MGAAELLLAALLLAPRDGGKPSDPAIEAGLARIVQRWNEAPSTVEELADELTALGPAAAPRLAELLSASGGKLPAPAVACALGRAGDDASVASLERLAAAEDPASQTAALAGLAQVRGEGSLAPMVAALESDSDEVGGAACDALLAWIGRNPELAWRSRLEVPLSRSRRSSAAARLLGELGTPEAMSVLRRLLASDAADLQSAALDGLVDGGRAEDHDALRSLLKRSRDRDVRKKICLALGRAGDYDAITELIEALGDKRADCVSSARWALQQITGQHLAADPELWTEWWTGVDKETLPDSGSPRLSAFVEHRARRLLAELLRAGVDDEAACAHVCERFSADAATVKGWIAESKGEPPRTAEHAGDATSGAATGSPAGGPSANGVTNVAGNSPDCEEPELAAVAAPVAPAASRGAALSAVGAGVGVGVFAAALLKLLKRRQRANGSRPRP